MLHFVWMFKGCYSLLHQVSKVKEQAMTREDTLQTKLLELESEKSRRETELRLLRQSKLTVRTLLTHFRNFVTISCSGV